MEQLFDAGFLQSIAGAKLLLVGVGGIGCEILKQLTVGPFKKIEIVLQTHQVDLDTIEISNLNRQFYFRAAHVGLSKAKVAAEIVSRLNPSLELVAHHHNIMSSQFDLAFFSKFKAVILALDNEEARSYVNKVCMVTNTLMLEAGTHGFLGQAMVLKRGITRCYDCFPRAQSKNFQVCTLRTLPDKPIHCLVWGKHLFSLIFGPPAEQNPLSDILESIDVDKALASPDLRLEVFRNVDRVFRKLYVEMLEEQKASNPEKFAFIKTLPDELIKAHAAFEALPMTIDLEADQHVLHELSFYISSFFTSAIELWAEKLRENKLFEFEKDEEKHIRFIIAASNLRSHCFGIPLVTEDDGRSQVGRIIPAICSSNSMVAALEVNELLKYLVKEYHFLAGKSLPAHHGLLANRECYIQGAGSERIKSSVPIDKNPDCKSCNLKNIFAFETDFSSTSIISVIERVLDIQPAHEYTVFIGAELIAECADYLEEDEVELYAIKTAKPCREFSSSNQLKMILEPEGLEPITIYVLHQPDSPDITLKWKIYPVASPSDCDIFVRESNKKVKFTERKTAAAPMPEPDELESLSDSEEAVEEVVAKKVQMDIECQDGVRIEQHQNDPSSPVKKLKV